MAAPPAPVAGAEVRDILGGVRAVRLSPVLAGRTEELKTLDAALARASAGEPQAFVVAGEAGVGKTRLVEEFLTAARAAGAVTAAGGCVELGADGLPFAPFTTALRALQRELGDDAISAAVGGREEELSRLLPDSSYAPPAGAPPHERDGRTRLFELTAQSLERLAADRTVVLALEDLHWSDRSTRELLSYLFRTLQATRLVVLATYRSDDIHRRHPLRPFLAELDRLRSVRRIELAPLSRDEVAAQLTGIHGTVPTPTHADDIHRRSEGNPFFVEELSANPDCSISESLRDLLLVRVERLAEPAQRVVRVAAEAGSHAEHALLAAVTGADEDELLDALRAAVADNVLVPDEDGESYRFRHALLREAVRDDLLPGERSRLNRRYAEVLQADPTLVRAEQRLTRIARHWHHGRDSARALPAVLAAAVEARCRHAFAEQYELLKRAMELWDDVSPEVRARLRPPDRIEDYETGYVAGAGEDAPLTELDLLAETVVAARLADERERALALTRRALEAVDEAAEPLRAAWLWVQRHWLVEELARGDGRAELDQALQLVRDLPPSRVPALVLACAAAWEMLHRPGQPAGLAAAELAVRTAAAAGEENLELNARVAYGIHLEDSGDEERGLDVLRGARDRARHIGDYTAAARAELNLAAALENLGRSREAAEVAADAARAAASRGRRDKVSFSLGNQMDSLVAMGRWEEAECVADLAERDAVVALTYGNLAQSRARLALFRGDVARAEALLAAARDRLGPQQTQPQMAIPLSTLTAAVAAARGDLTGAREEAARTIDAGLAPGVHRYGWLLLLVAAEAEGDGRRVPAFARGTAAALARIRTAAAGLSRSAPVWAAHALFLDAQAARAAGDPDPLRWAAAAAAFEPLDRPYELARVRHRWAEALLASGGDRERAADLLAGAHATAAALGATPLRTAVTALASRARLPLGGPDPAPADPVRALGLTSREQEVLKLVTAGRSNRQIAEELFISPKTASVHVSNLMAKLGVSGRGEAAATAHRLRLFEDA
ncbi:LuxR family transcriptional regulator [Streptomyces aculeolatus]|uniref:helix-turn-helix transcriptional regulator n=1 Tax=Streptomyces aculeolatus TaxID=270689 RepID=UPI0027DFF6F3|nr:AAA family ATPase [Streptomyces aculeolatus]